MPDDAPVTSATGCASCHDAPLIRIMIVLYSDHQTMIVQLREDRSRRVERIAWRGTARSTSRRPGSGSSKRPGRRFKRDGIDGSGIADADGRRRADQRRLLRALRRPRRTSSPPSVADQLRDPARQLRAQRRRPRGARAVRPRLPLARAPRPPRRRLSLGGPARRDRPLRRTPRGRRSPTGRSPSSTTSRRDLAPAEPAVGARARRSSIFALMVGTLQLARALADRQLADEILEQGVRGVLKLCGRRGLPSAQR